MSAAERSTRWQGVAVAITGRLASMTRDEAVRRLTAVGARYAESPDEQTAVLVVGQWGPPLLPDGRPTAAMRRARQLVDGGHPLRILPEEDFLAELGLTDQRAGIRRLYTSSQLARILSVPGGRVRAWVRHGLIQPVKVLNRLCFFDFQQVASARALLHLGRSGVTPSTLRSSLSELARWLPGAQTALAQLETLQGTGRILVRLEDGRLAEPSGQLQLFGEPTPHESAERVAPPRRRDAGRKASTSMKSSDAPTIAPRSSGTSHGVPASDASTPSSTNPRPDASTIAPTPAAASPTPDVRRRDGGRSIDAPRTAADAEAAAEAASHGPFAPEDGRPPQAWFEAGLLAESDGRLEEALSAYRRARLAGDDDPELVFNMGNTLYALGRRDEAATCFAEATTRDPTYVEAWNNLGNVLADQGRVSDAVRSFRRALVIAPDYADAHYNLAETLAAAGDLTGAREHWKSYLLHDPHGEWAEDVRALLEE